MNKNALSIAPITAAVAGRITNTAARASLVEEQKPASASWAKEPGEDVLAVATRLMMNLEAQERVIAIGSISEEDPSGLFSLNLALAMEQITHASILLIEGDAKANQICRATGISEEPGLCEVLQNDLDPENAIRPTAVPNIYILPPGQTQGRGKKLASDALRARFESLDRFQYVLLHVGQMVNRPAAMLLAAASHALIAAIAPDVHMQSDLRQFRKEAARMRSRFLGVSLVEQA